MRCIAHPASRCLFQFGHSIGFRRRLHDTHEEYISTVPTASLAAALYSKGNRAVRDHCLAQNRRRGSRTHVTTTVADGSRTNIDTRNGPPRGDHRRRTCKALGPHDWARVSHSKSIPPVVHCKQRARIDVVKYTGIVSITHSYEATGRKV